MNTTDRNLYDKAFSLEEQIIKNRSILLELEKEVQNSDNDLLADKMMFLNAELAYLNHQYGILQSKYKNSLNIKNNATLSINKNSKGNINTNPLPQNLGNINAGVNASNAGFNQNINQNSNLCINSNQFLNQGVPIHSNNNSQINMNNSLQIQNVSNNTYSGNYSQANVHDINNNFTNFNQINNKAAVNKIQKKSNWENDLGKKVMPILSACLIFSAIIFFAIALAPYMTDVMRQAMFFVIGFAAIGVGIVLKKKNIGKGFYNILMACGVGDIFVSILVCRIVFQSINDIAVLIGVLLWSVMVFFLKKNANTLFQIIAYIGIATCIIWGTFAAIKVHNADDLLVLYLFYVIATVMCFFMFRKKEDATSNFLFHLFNLIDLLGCFIGIVRCADHITYGVGICGFILAGVAVAELLILLFIRDYDEWITMGFFSIIYFAFIEIFLLYTIYKSSISGAAFTITGCVTAWLFIALIEFVNINKLYDEWMRKLFALVASAAMIIICVENSNSYNLIMPLMAIIPLMISGILLNSAIYRYASLVSFLVYSFVMMEPLVGLILGAVFIVGYEAIMFMTDKKESEIEINSSYIIFLIYAFLVLTNSIVTYDLIIFFIFGTCLSAFLVCFKIRKIEEEKKSLSVCNVTGIGLAFLGIISFISQGGYIEEYLMYINAVIITLMFSCLVLITAKNKAGVANCVLYVYLIIAFIATTITQNWILCCVEWGFLIIWNLMLYKLCEDEKTITRLKIVTYILAMIYCFNVVDIFVNEGQVVDDVYFTTIILAVEMIVNDVARYSPFSINYISNKNVLRKITYIVNQVGIGLGIIFAMFVNCAYAKFIISILILLMLPIGARQLVENKNNAIKLKNNIIFMLSEYMIVLIILCYILKWSDFISSIIGIVIALTYIILGFKYKYEYIRLYGLISTMIMIVKLVLFDFKHNSMLTYAISFLVAGLACFGISLLYYFISNNFKDTTKLEKSGTSSN